MGSAEELLASLGVDAEDSSTESLNTNNYTSNNSGRQGVTSTTEEKALELLGNGIANELVASAIGVTPARITQLLADENFALEVQKRRFINLQKHSMRDNIYDELEDITLQKLKRAIKSGMIVKPEMLLKALKIFNEAKRRGSASTNNITDTGDIVQINIPQIVKQTFVTNINNQVVQVGDRELETISADKLQKSLEGSNNVITQREDNSGGED
tara:strand:- start:37561 stop:38202 length:642 start_codon:yes stop_codon:yes gene_type:complete